MIDIRNLRQNPEIYKTSAKARNISVDIDRILYQDKRRLELLSQVEELRSKLNVKGKPSHDELEQLQQDKQKLEPLEKELTDLEATLNEGLSAIPNILAENPILS